MFLMLTLFTFWLFFMGFLAILMVLHSFWLVFMVFQGIFMFFLLVYQRQYCNFIRQSGLMFLRFIDNHLRLFLMVANHRSNNALFAMYRSSPSSTILAQVIFISFAYLVA